MRNKELDKEKVEKLKEKIADYVNHYGWNNKNVFMQTKIYNTLASVMAGLEFVGFVICSIIPLQTMSIRTILPFTFLGMSCLTFLAGPGKYLIHKHRVKKWIKMVENYESKNQTIKPEKLTEKLVDNDKNQTSQTSTNKDNTNNVVKDKDNERV